MKTLALLFALGLSPLALASVPRRDREMPAIVATQRDRIVNDQGKVEVWHWTRDSRGHTRLTIRDEHGRYLRGFVFEVPLP